MKHVETKMLNGPPPEASSLAWRGRNWFETPIKRFFRLEAAGGVMLMGAAALAMFWANTSHLSYEHFWHTNFGVSLNGFHVERSLHFLVNEVLMSIFFLLVGLEIKREMKEGELSNLKRASLPIAAAMGGMAVPAMVYAAFNVGSANIRGAAIPAATDIAFAVGVLMLLGKRVPPALRVLLLTLAVADDIGAILVIAVFYSQGLSLAGFLIAGIGVASFFILRLSGYRIVWLYMLPLAGIWWGLHKAGIHPTLSGVIVGLMVPSKPWIEPEERKTDSSVPDEEDEEITLEDAVELLRSSDDPHERGDLLRGIHKLSRESISPLERMQHGLHPWVVFLIMPLFALANAGVYLGGDTVSHLEPMIGLGIVAGLMVGKPLGILGTSLLAKKTKRCEFPTGVDWKGILLVGMMAGIGFTMSNFTALLSFDDLPRIGTAKLFILVGSVGSALLGLFLARFLLPQELPEGAAKDVVEAERSDDS